LRRLGVGPLERPQQDQNQQTLLHNLLDAFASFYSQLRKGVNLKRLKK